MDASTALINAMIQMYKIYKEKLNDYLNINKGELRL